MNHVQEQPIQRGQLSDMVVRPFRTEGLVFSSPNADVVAPLSAEALTALVDRTADTLRHAGVEDDDRVVVCLSSDGEQAATTYASAASRCAAAAVIAEPRGRLRTRQVIERFRGNVLVTTPCGAADLLARLHMEFLADPLDLGLRMIVLLGEITDRRSHAHLAQEFGAEVVELLVEPLFASPLAHRRPLADDGWMPAREVELSTIQVADGVHEFVAAYEWNPALAGVRLRTGLATVESEANAGEGADGTRWGAATHTVGDHLLARGRWVSLSSVRKALAGIDGIGIARLVVEREGTLDNVTLSVAFNRESLTTNPMWNARLQQALAEATPIAVQVEVAPDVVKASRQFEVDDRRGHHLSLP